MAVSSTVAEQAQNYGASINIISGIQGVSPGGQSSINMPVTNRIHRETFQCSGVAYVAPVVTVIGSNPGSGAVLTPVVTNGVITSIAITSGGASYTTPVTLLITDPSGYGTGATATATQSGGAINAVVVTNGGVTGPIAPDYFFTSTKHLVNGIVMRDISASDTLKLAKANGYNPAAGEFPVFFTEPWRKIVDHDQATAWDLAGQSTYQILLGIRSGITSPQLNGTYEFDYLRNARRGPDGKPILFLRPIKHHTFTYNVPAGVYNVTSLPVDYPIQRMWLTETGAGSIYQIELYQDGNKVLEGTNVQVNEMLNQYGFNSTVFDFSCVFDPDQRLGKALKVQNLVLRVYSTAPTALNVLMEIQSDNYS